VVNCFLGKNQLIKLRVFGHDMIVDKDDKGVSSELSIYGIHEPLMSVLISKTIREDDYVVDIGANIGYYVLIESSLLKQKGKIIAIEPNRRSFKLLKTNTANCNAVKTLQVAVGSKKETGVMLAYDALNLSRLATGKDAAGADLNQENTVEIMPLDELVSDEPHIDLIRMDIEGFEFEAINGMLKTLSNFRPRALFFELHPIENRALMDCFFELLGKLGYEVEWSMPRQLMPALLSVPSPLLHEVVQTIQTRKLDLSTTIESTKIPVETFAEHFFASKDIYHVIFSVKT
jgi:FkbM family methyltransferase